MGTRRTMSVIPEPAWSAVAAAVMRRMEGVIGVKTPRHFRDRSGRVLTDEERAAENVYIEQMERKTLEKLWREVDKVKAEAAAKKAA